MVYGICNKTKERHMVYAIKQKKSIWYIQQNKGKVIAKDHHSLSLLHNYHWKIYTTDQNYSAFYFYPITAQRTLKPGFH